jgi:predicted DsbA family dithiol-disulfide isomerase
MESWSVGFDGDIDVERHMRTGEEDTPARPSLRLRVVSDYICPWCYIGFTRVERLREEFDVRLEVTAFELRPGIPPEGMPREEASKGRVYPPGYLDNLRQAALDSGIDMKRPPVVPNTVKAHAATEYAREHGKLWEIHRALFRAYFEDEQDIGDPDIVCRVAAGIGLDREGLGAALADGRYEDAVRAQFEWARSVGITGVPTVIYDEKFALAGAQDYEVFADVARRIIARRGEG